MLSARVVPVLIFLFFSFGNLMPGKHLLIETESGDGESKGTVNIFYEESREQSPARFYFFH